MVMVENSQGSATGKEFVLQFFYEGAEVALSELNSRNFVCVLHTPKAICLSIEWEWALYSRGFSISTSLVIILRGFHLELEHLIQLLLSPMPVKLLFLVAWRNVFLRKVNTVVWAVVHILDAFPRTTGLRNANEACAGSPRQKPNPSHHLDWLMCVTMWEQGVAFHA